MTERWKKQTAMLQPPVLQSIGSALKKTYDTVVAEPVPDRFLALLEQLDSASVQANTKNNSVDRRVDDNELPQSRE